MISVSSSSVTEEYSGCARRTACAASTSSLGASEPGSGGGRMSSEAMALGGSAAP